MPTPNLSRGIHVRGQAFTDPKDPEGEVLLRIEVWPLPNKEMSKGLYEKIKDLLAKETDSIAIDLTGEGDSRGH